MSPEDAISAVTRTIGKAAARSLSLPSGDLVRTIPIELTECEMEMARNVGIKRWMNAVNEKRDPGRGPTSQKSAANDIIGAWSELATSIAFNLYWRPTIGELRCKDVGGLLEVKGTGVPDGHLIVKPHVDEAPYVLVLAHMAPLFIIQGWMWASQAKTFDKKRGKFDIAHWVQQKHLHPCSTLKDYLRSVKA